MSGDWLIWSYKHGGAWWRPMACGYTADVVLAGRFTATDADEAAIGSHGECVAVPARLGYAIVQAERFRVKQNAIQEEAEVRVERDGAARQEATQ